MKRAPNGEETYYAGSFIYKGSNLEYILHAEGKYQVSEEDGGYQYHLTDHLGNVRKVVKGDATKKILDQTDYYPLGMSMNMALHGSGQKNLYKYNGKELQEDKIGNGELDWYDYGARMYDPAIGRWHVIDNKAEKFYSYSTYTYAINNPLRFIDPDGNEIVDATGDPITYSKKDGWSSNATNDVKIIHAGLVQSKTGRAQWNKAYSSDSKINMSIVKEKLSSEKGGTALGKTNPSIGLDPKTAMRAKMEKPMTIKISIGSILESFGDENKGLNLVEAIGATAGHEIEHTTEENRDIAIFNKDYSDVFSAEERENMVEKEPRRVGGKIRGELRENKTSLKPKQAPVLDDDFVNSINTNNLR